MWLRVELQRSCLSQFDLPHWLGRLALQRRRGYVVSSNNLGLQDHKVPGSVPYCKLARIVWVNEGRVIRNGTADPEGVGGGQQLIDSALRWLG